MSGAFTPDRSSLIQTLENRILFSNFPPVSVPRNFTAAATSATTAVLNWTDESSNELGFEIVRATDTTDFETVIVTGQGAISWTDDGLLPSTNYFYSIRAIGDLETSVFSNTVAITTPPDSSADVDGDGTLFIHANTGTDVITLTDLATTIVVNVNGASSVFSKSLVDRIRLLTANNDHSITVDGNQAMIVRGNAEQSDIIGLSVTESTDLLNVKINGSVTSFSRSLIDRITVQTFKGDDRISTGPDVGSVYISGGDGNDTIFGNNGNDRLDGGNGADLIKGGDGNDNIKGGAGRDTLYGQIGNDTIQGGDGDDKIVGGSGNDLLQGNKGDDRLYGDEGIDTLEGGKGVDFLLQT